MADDATPKSRAVKQAELDDASSKDAIRPGIILAGQWELLKKLGVGGMGQVYKAFSRVERRYYAIKILDPRFADNPAMIARFEHEFCVLKRLTHSHIVKADSFFHAEGSTPFFYTMEFLEGEPLDKLVAAGPLDVDRAVRLILQICDAVASLHEVGVLHRDIKPANIVVSQRDGSEHATLLDLGVCKWTSRYYADLEGRTPPDLRRETKSGVVLGTPGFMGASEEDDDAEFRDVFGLGATLFRIVVGRMPFRGEPKPDSALQWQAADEERLPESLREALEGALGAAPMSRYQTVTAFRDELELVAQELALDRQGNAGDKAEDKAEEGCSDPPMMPKDDGLGGAEPGGTGSRDAEPGGAGSRDAEPRISGGPLSSKRTRAVPRSPRRLLALGLGIGLGVGLGFGVGIGINLGNSSSYPDKTTPVAPVSAASAQALPPDDVASVDEGPPTGEGLRIPEEAAGCIPADSSPDAFVDLELDGDGRLHGIDPGPDVDPLTVLCLEQKLAAEALADPGGQSTHRLRLTSLLTREGEHDEG